MANIYSAIDPGLEYVTSLGIRPGDNIFDLEGKLIRAGGKPPAQRTLREIDRRADRNGNRSDFYALKNQNLRISLALTGAFDGDILRKACNWVIDHREQFGSTILEIGCDCGVMKKLHDCGTWHTTAISWSLHPGEGSLFVQGHIH